MDEIAAAAGTSKTVVYRHFADRGELYVAVCARVAGQLTARLREAMASSTDPRARVGAAIETYLAFLEADPELYRFVVPHPLLDRPVDADPISSLSDLVGEQAAALVAAALVAGRPRPGARRAVGPRPGRPGPLGRRLVAARRPTDDPVGPRRPPHRTRLGRPRRRAPGRSSPRRRPRQPHDPGGTVTQSLPRSVDPQRLQEVLDGRWAHVRRDAREQLGRRGVRPGVRRDHAGGAGADHPAGRAARRRPAGWAWASPSSTAARPTPAAR